jgi:uncharacterized protein (DUF934 family)
MTETHTIIVTDAGFAQNDASQTNMIDLASDTPPSDLNALLDAPFIRIDFPSFADGRGFGLARRLRELGYSGRLRAKGHVIADQYAMARRSGFDEVEINAELAARQPEAQWRARADWASHDYQSRLRGVR